MKQVKNKSNGFWKSCAIDFQRNKFKYLIVLPVVIWLIMFCYKPMYGIIIAFKDYRPGLDILKCKWVGFRYFEQFFKDPYFFRILRNTIVISAEALLFCFPLPIILALMLNEVKNKRFKVLVQTVTYMPHFISLVIICGLVKSYCQSNGVINDIIALFGGERRNLLMEDALFRPIYLISESWKEVGWSSIIYLAALAGIDQEQYEAAKIDGASRIQQMIHITFPGLLPIISTMLILRIGSLLGVGYEKIMLLYNEATYEVADVISTYVYRRGIEMAQFSYSTAVGLFNSIVNLILLVVANTTSKKMGQGGLF